jgi:proline iminopeptidase
MPKPSLRFALVAVVIAACGACGGAPDETSIARQLTPGEGFIEVPGGRVWYEIAGSESAIPLLLLHGGPGAPSRYLDPLRALADERPVVLYDQLGGGKSDRPEDQTLWTVDRFVKELQAVRDALGLDEVHLFGHSWGTMLAVEYMLTEPQGVESLILASPALDIPRWLRDTNRLKSQLPEEVQEAIDRHEQAGTTDSEEYQAATMEFYRRHLCRSDPWPVELEEAFANFGWDVYTTMWGPSEFHATGSLADFDVTDRLGRITVPTLFTAGRYDEATPETTAWFQSLVPGSAIEIFEESAHMTMLDEPQRYVRALRDFLREVEDSGAHR